MIQVLLTSELPWKRYDATLFTCLCISRYQGFFFFFKNPLRMLAPPLVALIMTKFEQILCERFRNILKQSFKGQKNTK